MRACAKANVFLKMLGLNARGYHILGSRFVLLDEIYDEIELCKDKRREGFEIITEFSSEFGAECEKKGKFNAEFGANGGKKGETEFSGFNAMPEIKGENIISKAYKMLRERGFEGVLDECFSQFSLKLTKKIPIGGGLGGGSADAACFLKLMNETLNLGLSRDELMQMGARLGSDVSFFLSGFKSANVGGTGEIIAEFEDEIPPLKFTFPKIQCLTADVYNEFDKNPYNFAKNSALANELKTKTSKELLSAYENAILNDLFTPCVALYPKMSAFLQGGFFLSGSGSSVFKAEF